MKQKPLFFCDNCNYEVGDNIKVCPYCGRNFVSVRCPVCDYSGPDRMFQSGCPLCGYSAPSQPKIYNPKKTKSHKEPLQAAKPLPFWTYVATFLALLAMIALLSYLLTK